MTDSTDDWIDFSSLPVFRGVVRFAVRRPVQVAELEKEVETLKVYLNDALTERDHAIAALRAYEELLRRINDMNVKQKRLALYI